MNRCRRRRIPFLLLVLVVVTVTAIFLLLPWNRLYLRSDTVLPEYHYYDTLFVVSSYVLRTMPMLHGGRVDHQDHKNMIQNSNKYNRNIPFRHLYSTTTTRSSCSHTMLQSSNDNRSLEENPCTGTLLLGDNNIRITIEYSTIFHRHVVYRHNKNVTCPTTTLLESFLFLEDAVTKYPQAQLQPLLLPPVLQVRNDLTSMTSTSSSTTTKILHQIAGSRSHKANVQYPMIASNGTANDAPFGTTTTTTANQSDTATSASSIVYNVFRTLLNWTVTDVDQYIAQLYPISSQRNDLSVVQLQSLQDRIQFLLSPLPPTDILYQTNVTDDMDWPCLFYNQQYGAGLSPQQVTVALQQLPDPYFLLRDTFTLHQENDDSVQIYRQRQLLAMLYEQTPPAVV